MSCLSKLLNNPALPQVPGNLQKIIPSVLNGLPKITQGSNVANAFKDAYNGIKNQVSAIVHNTLDVITGKVGIGKEIKNLTTQLKNLPQAFVNSFNNVSSILSKQYQAVSDFIKCETTSISDAYTKLVETVNLQASVTQAANNISISGITNSVAKTLSTDINALNNFINGATEGAVAAGAANALTTLSNATVVASHNTAISSLQNLA